MDVVAGEAAGGVRIEEEVAHGEETEVAEMELATEEDNKVDEEMPDKVETMQVEESHGPNHQFSAIHVVGMVTWPINVPHNPATVVEETVQAKDEDVAVDKLVEEDELDLQC